MNDKFSYKKYLNLTKGLTISTLSLFILSSFFLIFNILRLNNIENLIRFLVVIFIIILIALGIFFTIKIIKKEHLNRSIVFAIIALLLTTVFGIGGFYINKAYNSINKLNKNEVTYGTSLVVLSNSNVTIDNLKNKKIGIIKDTQSIEGYIISQEIIEEKNIDKNTFVEYDDFIMMVNDLYDGNVDAIFISHQYTSMYSSIEHFANIGDETKVLFTKKKKMEKKEELNSNTTANVTEPFTMLIMGVQSPDDDLEALPTSFNADTLILLTFNPKTLNATIVSIPRDTFVPIMCMRNQIQNKITHSGWSGESCVIKTVENFTGLDINYYVKVNFMGVVKLVDAVDGIQVDVPYSFCEQNSKRSWGSATVFVEKGLHTLNGEQALALSRNRHKAKDGSSVGATMSKYCPTYTEGARNDIVRGKNQQLVINALANKIKDVRDINKLYQILDLLEKNMDTNLTTNQILSFYNIGKDILAKSKTDGDVLMFQKLQLKTYGQYIYDERARIELSNQIYYKGSLNEIVDAMKINLGLKEPKIIKDFSFSINKPYVETTIGNGYYNESGIPLVPDFTTYTKEKAISWGNSKGIAINFETVESSNSNYKEGQITYQSIPKNSLLSLVNKTKGITLNIIKKKAVETTKIDCTKEENKEEELCLIPDFTNQTINELNAWKKNIIFSPFVITTKDIKTNVQADNNKITFQTKDLIGKYIYDVIDRTMRIEYYKYEKEEDFTPIPELEEPNE